MLLPIPQIASRTSTNTIVAASPAEIQKMNENLFTISLKCLGWSKFMSLFIYLILYFYSRIVPVQDSKTDLVNVLQGFLLFAILPNAIYGSILLYGAYTKNQKSISIALFLCLVLACIDMVIGSIGCYLYFSRIAHTVNFILVCIYLFLCFELLWCLCYDFPQILIYRQLLSASSQQGSQRTHRVELNDVTDRRDPQKEQQQYVVNYQHQNAKSEFQQTEHPELLHQHQQTETRQLLQQYQQTDVTMNENDNLDSRPS